MSEFNQFFADTIVCSNGPDSGLVWFSVILRLPMIVTCWWWPVYFPNVCQGLCCSLTDILHWYNKITTQSDESLGKFIAAWSSIQYLSSFLFFFYLFANHFRTFYWPHSLVCLFRPECFFFGWCHQVWMKALIGKLGKINVSLGLRRLHYKSCSINRFLIDVSC